MYCCLAPTMHGLGTRLHVLLPRSHDARSGNQYCCLVPRLHSQRLHLPHHHRLFSSSGLPLLQLQTIYLLYTQAHDWGLVFWSTKTQLTAQQNPRSCKTVHETGYQSGCRPCNAAGYFTQSTVLQSRQEVLMAEEQHTHTHYTHMGKVP